MSSDRQPHVRGIAWLLLCGIAAGILLPLTAVLAGKQDGDGMLTALISTQKLTWYFWGQDRLLNFLPALAHMVEDVEWNLRLQVALRATFAYLSPLGILIFLDRQPRFLLIGLAIANIILMSGLSHYGLFNLYVQHNTTATSLVLLAVAYALTYSRLPWMIMAPLAVLICSLAYATNSALLTYSLPTIFMLGVLRREQFRRHAGFLLLNLLAVALAALHARYFGEPSTAYGLTISPDAMLVALKVLHDNLHLFLLACWGGLAVWCLRICGESRVWELAAVTALALGLILLMASLTWVQLNLYNIRYFLLSLIVLAAVIAYPITRALLASRLGYRGLVLCCLVGLGNCVFLPLGGFDAGYKDLMGVAWRDQSAAVAREAITRDTRVITGDFWDVWAAVYRTKQEQFDVLPKTQRGELYGAAYKGDVLREQFLASVRGKGVQNALCFYPSAERCIQEMATRFHLPPERIELKGSEALQVRDRHLLSLGFEIR